MIDHALSLGRRRRVTLLISLVMIGTLLVGGALTVKGYTISYDVVTGQLVKGAQYKLCTGWRSRIGIGATREEVVDTAVSRYLAITQTSCMPEQPRRAQMSYSETGLLGSLLGVHRSSRKVPLIVWDDDFTVLLTSYSDILTAEELGRMVRLILLPENVRVGNSLLEDRFLNAACNAQHREEGRRLLEERLGTKMFNYVVAGMTAQPPAPAQVNTE